MLYELHMQDGTTKEIEADSYEGDQLIKFKQRVGTSKEMFNDRPQHYGDVIILAISVSEIKEIRTILKEWQWK